MENPEATELISADEKSLIIFIEFFLKEISYVDTFFYNYW